MSSSEQLNEGYAPVDRTGAFSGGQTHSTGQLGTEVPLPDPSANAQQPSETSPLDALPQAERGEGAHNQPAGDIIEGEAGQLTRKEKKSTWPTADLLTPKERKSIRPSRDYSRVWGTAPTYQESTEFGLPLTAAEEDEMLARRDMKQRKALTTALKWGGDAEVQEQLEQEGRDPYPTWERILFYALNLSNVLPDEIPPEDLAHRITLARKVFARLEKEIKNSSR